MNTVEVLLGIAQGLLALLVGLGGWILRHALDDVERLKEQYADARVRLAQMEVRLGGVERLEAKLDQPVSEVREVRERLASLSTSHSSPR